MTVGNFKTKNTFLKGAIIATSIVSLSGCASSPSKSDDVGGSNLNSMKYLEEISIDARQSLRTLAKMKEAETMDSLSANQHAQLAYQSMVVPRGFGQRVDIDIESSAEQVTKVIAQWAGYDFEVVGDSDGQRIPVDIYQKDRPLKEALNELSAQTGDLAQIELDQASSKIYLNFTPKRIIPNIPQGWRE